MQTNAIQFSGSARWRAEDNAWNRLKAAQAITRRDKARQDHVGRHPSHGEPGVKPAMATTRRGSPKALLLSVFA